ncbi:LLM class flavin-dependent oxidoreductase [Saccharothrix stipae]
MDVYLPMLGDHLPNPHTGRAVTECDRMRAIVEQAVAAEEAGFVGVAIGEHHFTRYIVSAPELLLATIAERTSGLRLSTGVTLPAHHAPVRVAENLATLDVLSQGRAELIVARGVSQRTDVAFAVQEAPQSAGGRHDDSASRAAPRPLMLPSTLRDPCTHRPVVERYREAMGERGRVALRLNRLTELLNLDAQLVMVDIGGLPHRAVLDTIRLFSREVLPNLTPSPSVARRATDPPRAS